MPSWSSKLAGHNLKFKIPRIAMVLANVRCFYGISRTLVSKVFVSKMSF